MTTKEQVLALLEAHRGEHLSGEALAQSLGVSRNAVWKAIKDLQTAGHAISAATNKGYRLDAESDVLSVQGIAPFLADSTLANHLTVYDSLESTNKTAKELALSGAAHGTTVVANAQTAGRGRYQRSFFSPPEQGMYFTLVLHPSRFGFANPTLITAYAAVAVCEAIETVCGKAAGIKWVNDIFLDGKKICGILTEAVTDFESGQIQWIVVGIGINFCAKSTDFPEALRSIAGAVFLDEAPTANRNRLLAEVINRMVPQSNALTAEEMLARYKSRLMMLNKQVQVVSAAEQYPALALDIDAKGRLLVQTETGEKRLLSSGEIRIKL